MRSGMIAAILLSAVSTLAHAREMGGPLDGSGYIAIWKSAAPDAFASQGPTWARHTPDFYDTSSAECVEYIATFGNDKPKRSCELLDVGPGRLLTFCGDKGGVNGLYDSESQRKLDELELHLPAHGVVRFVRLTSGARWDIRVADDASGGDASYYSVVDGKLVRVAVFDSRYEPEQWVRGLLHPIEGSRSARFSFRVLGEYQGRHGVSIWSNDRPAFIEVGVVLPVDDDHDGFNERLDLTTLRFAPATDDVVRFNSPGVTRTLTWTPKTHTYED